jgi:hypothetical protein
MRDEVLVKQEELIPIRHAKRIDRKRLTLEPTVLDCDDDSSNILMV